MGPPRSGAELGPRPALCFISPVRLLLLGFPPVLNTSANFLCCLALPQEALKVAQLS